MAQILNPKVKIRAANRPLACRWHQHETFFNQFFL